MEWKIDPAHSAVDFSVRYLVSTTRGRFTGLRGPVRLSDVPEGETPELVSFEAVFETGSFQTGIPPRDRRITGPEFLDVETYPEAAVRLVSLRKERPSAYVMTVELTLHGATRTVELVAETAGPVKDHFGVPRVGATATGRLKRADFGVVAFPGVISDEVEFTVDVQAVPASVPDDQLPPAR